MANEPCAVVEVIVLATDYQLITDEAFSVTSTAIAYDYALLSDAQRDIEEVVIVTDVFEGEGYVLAVSQAGAGNSVAIERGLLLEERAMVTDGQRLYVPAVLEERVEAYAETELAVGNSLQSRAKVLDAASVITSVELTLVERRVAIDIVTGSETVTISDVVLASALALEEDSWALTSYAAASSSLVPSLQFDVVLANNVVARDLTGSMETASILELSSVVDAFEPVTNLVIQELVRSTTHLALGTTFILQMTEHVSASEYLVGDGASVVEEWLTAVDTQQSAVRAQGQLRSEAIAQDQPAGEVDRGYFVHDQLAASESLRTEISAPLEVLVLANDHVGLGFEAVAPETAGDTYASAEMTGQGVVYAQCSEALLATATVEFLVGTTSGVYEMLAVEHITVYDRVEVVEALDSFAWVMNSQSLAHSYYDGFVDFNSAAQLGKRIYMLSPSGLYELGGDSDDGKIIEAEVVTGQMDFGTIARKRVEQIDLGYVASGDLQAVVSCEGFAPSEPQTLEVREMRTAHTSRVRVGKGMVGKYWKFELKNREGADFELFSIQSKVALSTRRMR